MLQAVGLVSFWNLCSGSKKTGAYIPDWTACCLHSRVDFPECNGVLEAIHKGA